jgi:hypothetical protein
VRPRIEEGYDPHLGPVCMVKVGAALYGLFFGRRRREEAEARRDEVAKQMRKENRNGG